MVAESDSPVSAWAVELLPIRTISTWILDIGVGDAVVIGSALEVAESLDAACERLDKTGKEDCGHG